MWAGDISINKSQDGSINMLDVMGVAKSFNTVKGDNNVNVNVDFNQDDNINMLDIMIIAKNFNQILNDYQLI